jgi:hypothetical protein
MEEPNRSYPVGTVVVISMPLGCLLYAAFNREEGGESRQDVGLLSQKSAAPHNTRECHLRFCEHCSKMEAAANRMLRCPGH